MSVEEFEERLRSGLDVYYARQTISSASSLLEACNSHILDVVLKHQKRILKNNQLKTISTMEEESANGRVTKRMLSIEEEDKFRDQGFTRPRVLVLTPFRNQAYDLIKLSARQWMEQGSGRQVDGLKRFEQEFAGEECQEAKVDKGDVFRWQFRGNIDDCYRIGIKCTRKAMKLFSEFYSSDIIVASPLGLRLVIDGGGERGVAGEGSKKRKKQAADFDFLSSIQLVIIDQADVMSMQNWEHLQIVMEHLNRIPTAAHECDFTRVMKSFLDGKAAEGRQTVMISAFQFPELNALWSKYDKPGAWKVDQLLCEVTPFKQVCKKAKIFFQTFASPSLVDLPSARLEGFKRAIFDSLRKLSGACVFVSSYFDFCQLREFLESQELSFITLSEYTSTPDINRVRAKFFNGQVRILLVSERFHFFRRYKIRGIKHLFFYTLPEYNEYFGDWVNMLVSEQPDMNDIGKRVSVLVEPRYDRLALERIVGAGKAQRLLE